LKKKFFIVAKLQNFSIKYFYRKRKKKNGLSAGMQTTHFIPKIIIYF